MGQLRSNSPHLGSKWWNPKWTSWLSSGSAIVTILTFIVINFNTPDVDTDTTRLITIKASRDKLVFWQYLDLENLGRGFGFIKIQAYVTNTSDNDSCLFSSNIYVKDNILHEFKSIHINNGSENQEGHFKFSSNKSNLGFLKPDIIYRLTLNYSLSYRFWYLKRSKSFNEIYYFTLTESMIERLKNDASDGNDYKKGIEVQLLKL